MGKIKGMKDIEDDKEIDEILNNKYTGDSADDIAAEESVKETPSKIKIKAFDECIEIIDKFIREKSKTRNVFYVSDFNEIRNRIVNLQEKAEEKNDNKNWIW